MLECGENGEEKAVDVPECRKRDREIDELARRAAETLRDACYPERGGDGNEWGVAIYRDDAGGIRLSRLVTSGDPDFIDPGLMVGAAGGDIRQLVAIMHCHPNGTAYHSSQAGDVDTLFAYGQTIADSTPDGRERDFRSYVVTQDEIDEKAYRAGACNEEL